MSIRKYIFYLAPQFSMMSLLPLTEVLRKANELSEKTLYEYKFVASQRQAVAINGMLIDSEDQLPQDADMAGVIVCASYQTQIENHKPIFGWLRWLARHGVPIGVTDTGGFITAKAGLSWAAPICVHWLSRSSFHENFPELNISENLYEYTPQRFSCIGATAGLDLMLHIVATHHGQDFASRVGSHLVFGYREQRHLSHHTSLADFFDQANHPAVAQVLLAMEASRGSKRPIPDFAAEAGLSQTQLNQLFKHNFSLTPARVYQIARLRRAQGMIRSLSTPIEAIAEKCGFASRSQFTAAYKSEFGLSPSAARGTWDQR